MFYLDTFELAALLESTPLRSLDALHIAAALETGPKLDGIVTYDVRPAEASASLGISVISPR